VRGEVRHMMVTDKLRSYAAATTEMGLSAGHEQRLRKNNRAENSHQPVRRREYKMQAKAIGSISSGPIPPAPSAARPTLPARTRRDAPNEMHDQIEDLESESI
jgi:hypothetical protein